jgi:hypothetical protein
METWMVDIPSDYYRFPRNLRQFDAFSGPRKFDARAGNESQHALHPALATSTHLAHITAVPRPDYQKGMIMPMVTIAATSGSTEMN